MSTDIIVSHVTFTSHELALRLNHEWRELVVDKGKVLLANEPVAGIEKRGGRVSLAPIGPRDVVRWVAWAIQSICPGAEAEDPEAEPSAISDEPMTAEDAETAARGLVAARHAAIAKDADPTGGAQEAVALITYLVQREKLELCGPIAAVVRAIVPAMRDVDDGIGAKLEDVLLDVDEVDELYADADELTKIVLKNEHIFDS